MSRRRVAKKREILADPKFNSLLLSKVANNLMENGKKSVAEKLIYFALEKCAERYKRQDDEGGSEGGVEGGSKNGAAFGLTLLEKAIENLKPMVEVRSRRVGGATYQVPVEVRASRQKTLAIRWLLASARQRSEKGMGSRLAHEILDAVKGVGNAIKKKEEAQRMAKANQAFAHFRWN